MKNFQAYFTMILAATVLLLTSCFGKLNLEPKYGLNSSTVYADPANYINVLAKIYGGLAMSGNQGPAGNADISGIDEGFSQYIRVYWNLQELPTDEAICGWNDPGIPELNTMTWGATNSFANAMYFRIYFQLALINEFMRETTVEKLQERGFGQTDIDRITLYRNEARFLRALSYMHALDLFGNVPFVTEEDRVGSYFPEQIFRADLFTFVEEELLAVEPVLMDPWAGFDVENYARANKAVVWMTLAKLYLNAEVWSGSARYTDAANWADKIIDQGGYSLEPKYRNLFLTDNHTSTEIIFPIPFDGTRTQNYGGTTFLTHAFLGGTMPQDSLGIGGPWAGYRTTRPLVEKFEEFLFSDNLNASSANWQLSNVWTDTAGMLTHSTSDGGYNFGAVLQSLPYGNNREIEVSFIVSGFETPLDANKDIVNNGGYIAIGDGTSASSEVKFSKNGPVSFLVNTGSASDLRFYGINSEFMIDEINIVYRDGDTRFQPHINGQTLEIDEIAQFDEGFAMKKFRNLDRNGTPGSDPTKTFVDVDYPFYRLADAYLIYAECAARGAADLERGKDLVNDLRERAYGNADNNITSADLTPDFVLEERARELYWEAHRRQDLIRYGKFTNSSYLWPWKGGVRDGQAVPDYYILYPIPQADIVANPTLIQNGEY